MSRGSKIEPEMDKDLMAPAGYLWVCCACGKTSEHKYGTRGASDYGWDESCMLNSTLFHEKRIVYSENGRVIEVLEDFKGNRKEKRHDDHGNDPT